MIISKSNFEDSKKKFVKKTTSWEPVADWYDKSVGKEGHYYHSRVIFPNLFKKWKLKKGDLLLDLASGQGVLARQIPKDVEYVGVDISHSLIKSAKELDKNPHHHFLIADITKEVSLPKKEFSHAICILALQNLENPEKALSLMSTSLKKGGKFALIINHPYFRIPRQTSWGVDDAKKLQYRRVDTYLSPLTIPIDAHPGKGGGEKTFSHHFSLASLTSWLEKNGLAITAIDEWCSDKVSEGSKAKMENRARNEFPLFMAVFGVKL